MGDVSEEPYRLEYCEEESEDSNKDDPSRKWMVCIYLSTCKVRFVRVKDRTAETLLSVIKKYVSPGSVIWIDLWRGYNALCANDFIHETVNHSQHFVDPDPGCHTQRIERPWIECKAWWHETRGNKQLLRSHLEEASWGRLRSNERSSGDLFEVFLHDMALVCR